MSPLPGAFFERHEIRTESCVFRARQAVGRAMDGLQARAIRKTRIVTAASEIFRNGLIYGGGAIAVIHTDPRDAMVWIECRDEGPGIADVDQALEDGFTSGTGLGRGLGGAKRLSDRFEITSTAGQGTRIRFAARA
ncbi:ATP-binding protein [Sagittula sp. SSi028]|uniref:ATP-binding protein n=1 Tax=Sagittula sp. SSi028 TaxID=3400636 RepID=UPI003AF9861D